MSYFKLDFKPLEFYVLAVPPSTADERKATPAKPSSKWKMFDGRYFKDHSDFTLQLLQTTVTYIIHTIIFIQLVL